MAVEQKQLAKLVMSDREKEAARRILAVAQACVDNGDLRGFRFRTRAEGRGPTGPRGGRGAWLRLLNADTYVLPKL
jgi:hypothetical protein